MSLGLSLADLGLLFFYLSPFFLLLLIPIACMLSVFLTFLRMSSDRELIALKSGGIGLMQLTPAPAVFSVLCTAITLFVSLYGLSWGMHHFRDTLVEYARTQAQLVLQPGVFNQEFPGLMVYARNVDINNGVMQHIIVEDRSREPVSATILAPIGRVKTLSGKGQVLIALENGRIYQQDKDQISVLSFDNYTVRLDLSKLLHGWDVDELKPKEMSWKQLRKLLDHPEERTDSSMNYFRKIQLELHKRWVFPAACLILGLFAVPLACAFEGLNRQYGIFLALGCFLIYYTLLSLGLSLGESGVVPPIIGLWLPNTLFLIFGIIGLRFVSREKRINIRSWISLFDVRRWRRQ